MQRYIFSKINTEKLSRGPIPQAVKTNLRDISGIFTLPGISRYLMIDGGFIFRSISSGRLKWTTEIMPTKRNPDA